MKPGAALVLSAALAACARTPSLPAGWTLSEIPDCCTIGLPPKTDAVHPANAIDDPVTIFQAPQFQATITVTSMGTALPLPSSGRNYQSSERTIDGRKAEIAMFQSASPNDPLPDRRHLLWHLKGKPDGTGRALVMEFACRDSGCGAFEPIVSSLRHK